MFYQIHSNTLYRNGSPNSIYSSLGLHVYPNPFRSLRYGESTNLQHGPTPPVCQMNQLVTGYNTPLEHTQSAIPLGFPKTTYW